MRINKLLEIDLQLFNDGGAGGAASAGANASGDGAVQTVESELPKAEHKMTGRSRRSKTGELSNVVYGKQDAVTDTETPAAEGKNGEGNTTNGVSTTSNTLEDKRAAFRNLVEGEYKDQYTEMFQQAFNRRFKEVKSMEDSLNAQKPVLDMLMQRYKIGDGDMKKLQEALEQDNTYWEGAAEEAGLTVEQFKAVQKLERENEELKRFRQRQAADQQARQQIAKWNNEAEQMKSIYPAFNFQAELGNREFADLLKAGVPVQKAYELVHMEEIKEGAAKAAAQSAGAQLAAKIKSKAARPQENGTSAQSAAIVKSDVSNLSRADRAEIARRVQRGELIKF